MRNPNIGTKLGRERRPFWIKEILDAKGLRYADVAERAGVAVSLVTRTIRGNANNKKVLHVLREIGVPDKALALPQEMLEQPARQAAA